METTRLRLYLGYPTAYTLGLATTTPSQPAPEVIDLLAPGIIVREAGGSSDWIPTIAGTKNGQWADSETANGRTPVSLPTANAIESLSLVASSTQAGIALLAELNRFAEIGRLFWTETAQRPLYLEWAASSGAGSQFALIYNMQAAIEQFDAIENAEEPLVVSLSIEREAAWRGIAPGLPAKYWTLISRGLQPTTAASPSPTGFFNVDDLNPLTGAGDKASLYTLTNDFGDELGTNNRNFIDVDGADIPGDAPALVWILNDFNSSSITLNYSKDSNIDFGTANAFGVAGTYAPGTRRRMRFNAGDWALGAASNVTITKQINAAAWLGNGSIVNRTAIQLVFAAGVAGSTTAVASFIAPMQAYAGSNYAVFLTSAGGSSAVTVRATIAYNDTAEQAIGSVVPSRTSALVTGRSDYLGTVSFPDQRSGGFGGFQTAVPFFTIRLYVSKPGATTPTLNLFDIALVPITEGSVSITPTGLSTARTTFDNTGYASSRDIFAGSMTGNRSIPNTFTGNGFQLTPGITNRIYVFAGIGNEDTNYTTTLNLIPRWYGVRTV